MAMGAHITLALLTILVEFLGCSKGGPLPASILERLSPLDDVSALRIKQEIQASGTISLDSCKAAGFLCGRGHDIENTDIVHDHQHNHDHSGRSALESIQDAAAKTFFQLKTLVGAKDIRLPPPLRWDDSLPASKFLHAVLEPVLGAMDLPQLLRTMGFSSQSQLATVSRESLSMCSMQSNKDEIKGCHISVSSILNQASSILHKIDLNYATNAINVSDFPLETFAVEETSLVAANGSIACHPMTFPFALYMCHTIPRTLVLKVTLRSQSETSPKAIVVPAVCHMDTSDFKASHIAFTVLKTQPGMGEVCHWLPVSHLVWY